MSIKLSSLMVCKNSKREAITTGLSQSVGGKMKEKNIRFRNNDVPAFLRRLADFEHRSRQSNVLVK